MRSNIVHFRERQRHAWNKIKWHIPDDVKTGRFVDIGCGIGNGVAAALAHGASMAVGIDRSFSEFQSEFDVADFPILCHEVGASSLQGLLLEGDIFGMTFPGGQFDYAMMLDSAEHVPDPAAFFKWAAAALRPGGYFLMDTCPLYYSPVGAHLWHWFSAQTDPWAHLKPGFRERFFDLRVNQWSIDRFDELNRATHESLRTAFVDAGFEVVEEHRSVETPEMTALFERFGEGIDLGAIKREWLFEDWILLVGRKL